MHLVLKDHVTGIQESFPRKEMIKLRCEILECWMQSEGEESVPGEKIVCTKFWREDRRGLEEWPVAEWPGWAGQGRSIQIIIRTFKTHEGFRTYSISNNLKF